MRAGRLTAVICAVALAAAGCADTDGDADADGRDVDASSTTVVWPTVPSALDDPNDPGLPPPSIDTALLVDSGVGVDEIPAIDQPDWFPVERVGWLEDQEPVIAIEIEGDARAYPLMVMTWHEIVNDEVAGIPMTITFCPLCNSAVAFERTVDAGELTFGVSGLLFNSSLVMYDRQTESLWTHFDGTAVAGSLAGTELRKHPVQIVSWADFRDTFPEGQVLTRATGFSRPYGRNPYPGYDAVGQRPFFFEGEIDGRIAAKERVVAIRGDETKVVLLSELADASVVELEFDGRAAVVLHTDGTSSALDDPFVELGRDIGATGVFDRELDGQLVELVSADDGFLDIVSGSTFDIFGRAVDGPLLGEQLRRIDSLDTFWFAIAAFDPETRIVDVP